MKIIIISAVAPPEPLVAGLINRDICQHMAEQGHEVWLISSRPSRPIGFTYPIVDLNEVVQVSERFHHVRVKSYVCPEYQLFGRFYESFDFGLKSIRYVNRNFRDYDLMYASVWAFLGQLMIVMLKRNKRAPLIMNIQDLYPESFFTKLKSNRLIKLLKPLVLIDKFIAKKSDHLTVVSETLEQVYLHSRSIPGEKITVLHNWQDETEFLKPVDNRDRILAKYDFEGLRNKFVFMYLGNIGPVADVPTVIEAFNNISCSDAVLVVAGSGSGRDQCIELAERNGMRNIVFVSVPAGLTSVVEIQSIADVLVLPIVPGGANSSIPSKLIAYMFSAKPVISSATSKSETAEAIITSGCGWITPHTSADWASVINEAYRKDKDERTVMGRSGYEFGMKYYSKRNGLNKIEELFGRLTRQVVSKVFNKPSGVSVDSLK
jgi:glycosyltransferase involved in cell wall biosynthesis